MRQIGSLVVVEGEAKLALIRAEMVPHEVGVLLEVDGLGGEGRQTLAPVAVRLRVGGRPARASLGPHAVLEVHHLGGRVGGAGLVGEIGGSQE